MPSTRVVHIGGQNISVTEDNRANLRSLLRNIFERNELEEGGLHLTDAQISELIEKSTGREYPPRYVAVARHRYNNGKLGNAIPERASQAWRG